MSTVLDQIEQQIAKLSSKAVKKNTGNIRTIADIFAAFTQTKTGAAAGGTGARLRHP